MIQSKKELVYDARNGEKKGIILVDIISWNTLKEVTTYNVIDYVLLPNGSKEIINQKEVTYTSEQLDEIDSLLENTNDYASLSKTAKDFLKASQGLLLVTQQKPIYGSLPEDWQLYNE